MRVCAYVRGCMFAGALVRKNAYVHAYVRTCVHVHVCAPIVLPRRESRPKTLDINMPSVMESW